MDKVHTYSYEIHNKEIAHPTLMPQVISNKEISFLYISSRVEGHVEQVQIYIYDKKGQNSFFFLLIDVIA